MYGLARPVLFSLAPDTAHAIAMAALFPLEHMAPLRGLVRRWILGNAGRDPRLVRRVMGIDFPNPVGLAGGFDKNAKRARSLAALGFGFLELGTVTADAQAPNPPPNLFRLTADRALVNRLGFPNEGAARVTERIAKMRARGAIGVPVGISIGKSRSVPVEPIQGAVEDYLTSYRLARRAADFVVVNVSSPNTKGLRAMQGGEIARALFEALERENASSATRVPLLVKIAPDLDHAGLDELLDVAMAAGLDGVVATNTTLSRAGLATSESDVERVGAGGLSGPPLRARALEVVRRVRERIGADKAVIGVGGIEGPDDARALLDAGADLVQLYTGFVYGGPSTAARIVRGLVTATNRRR
ncbi:MAG: pyrD [Myxococcaceae bacterium]|nr:pyrD [Myxococcaceae bacterium]